MECADDGVSDAHHGVATLVIVDREELAEQWRASLVEFVGLTNRQVGQLGGGRSRRSGSATTYRRCRSRTWCAP